jgi:TPP-dependent pyruvate/acetoin dehydrogenase alpha subunit
VSDTKEAAVPQPRVLRHMFEVVTAISRTDAEFRRLLSSGRARSTYYPPKGQESATGLMVTTGIVGSGLPIANGLAWSSQLRGTDRVTVVNFGDGASNIGALHEALNMAAVWPLPVVFVCQNNRCGEHTRYEWATSVPQVALRAGAHGIPGVTVDGHDPVAVYRAAAAAIARARAGAGPTLLEAVTYRVWGHSHGDDMRYTPPEERRAAMDADPTICYRSWLLDHGHVEEDELAAIEAQVDAAIGDALSFALERPPPALEELHTDGFEAEAARA